MDLDVAMTPRRTGERTFAWDVPDGWQQGKGAFGGLVTGALIGAAEATLADPARPLRVLTAELMGPALVGPAVIEVTCLRAGSSVTVLSAALRQPQTGDDVVAHGVLTFGRDRDPAIWQSLAPPSLPPWREVAAPTFGPPAATFVQHVEFRPVSDLPFRGGPTSHEVQGWVRFRKPGAVRGAGYLAACCDAYWPAALTGMAAPRPMATLTFTLQLIASLDGLDPDEPFAYRARALAAGSGYIPEVRELWTSDGRLIAINPQTFALSR